MLGERIGKMFEAGRGEGPGNFAVPAQHRLCEHRDQQPRAADEQAGAENGKSRPFILP